MKMTRTALVTAFLLLLSLPVHADLIDGGSASLQIAPPGAPPENSNFGFWPFPQAGISVAPQGTTRVSAGNLAGVSQAGDGQRVFTFPQTGGTDSRADFAGSGLQFTRGASSLTLSDFAADVSNAVFLGRASAVNGNSASGQEQPLFSLAPYQAGQSLYELDFTSQGANQFNSAFGPTTAGNGTPFGVLRLDSIVFGNGNGEGGVIIDGGNGNGDGGGNGGSPQPVPEAGTLVLLSVGFLSLIGVRRVIKRGH